MRDAETIVEVVRKLIENRVAWMAFGHDQMSRERNRGGAQRPDVEIMDGVDARASLQPFCDFLSVNRVRNSVKR